MKVIRGMIKLYIVDYHDIIPHKEQAMELVTGERLYKALKYVKEEDSLRSLTGSLLMRKHTGGLENIKYDFYGKPYKDNVFFSLSHSNDYVVLAVGDTNLGVDIEKNRARNPKLQDYVLSDEEKKEIKEDIDFYKMWTSKESLVKFTGFGIDRDLKKLTALPLNGDKEFAGRKCHAFNMVYKDDYVISVTSEHDDEIEIVEEKVEDLINY